MMGQVSGRQWPPIDGPLLSLMMMDDHDHEWVPRQPLAKTQLNPNTKVALFGDQGLSDQSKQVLQMIKEWGADFVIHAGDFDYADNPKGFVDQFRNILGEQCI